MKEKEEKSKYTFENATYLIPGETPIPGGKTMVKSRLKQMDIYGYLNFGWGN